MPPERGQHILATVFDPLGMEPIRLVIVVKVKIGRLNKAIKNKWCEEPLFWALKREQEKERLLLFKVNHPAASCEASGISGATPSQRFIPQQATGILARFWQRGIRRVTLAD